MMIALGLAASLGVALAPASVPAATISAAPVTTYMVQNIEVTDDVGVLGEFHVIRRDGKRAIGISGAFQSEFVCWRGMIRKRTLKAEVQPFAPGDKVTTFSRKVVGGKSATRFRGTELTTRKKIITFADGQFDPREGLRSCKSWTRGWL